MNTPNILNIEDNGYASIEIPQIQMDYSFMLNHWQDSQDQVKEIQNDLFYPDSEKRKLFLEKAQRLLLEYSQLYPVEDEDEDDEFEINVINEEADDYELPQELIDDLSDVKPMEPYCDDYERERKIVRSNMSIECCDDDQEEEYMENIQYLKVFNFKLKHSLAWYLMIRVDNEIILIEQEIEKYSGLLKMLEKDEISNVIDTIRKSNSLTQALNAVMGKFQLSKIQTEHILETRLKDLMVADEKQVSRYIEYCYSLLSFLNALNQNI